MTAQAGPLVVVDRDGVVNADSIEYIKSPAEWHALPGALDAIARLNAAGFRVAVATNQSGIGRGLFTEDTLASIHGKMAAAVAEAGGRLDGIYYCPHTPWDGCQCRKPKPGLLLQAAAGAGVAPDTIVFIGDKASDVGAARAIGARPLLIDPDGAWTRDAEVERFRDLAAAVDRLLAEAEGSS